MPTSTDYCLEELEQLVLSLGRSPSPIELMRHQREYSARDRLLAIAVLLAHTRRAERLLLDLLEQTDD